MAKPKKLLLTVMFIIVAIFAYSWSIILFNEIEATWRHYLACIPFK